MTWGGRLITGFAAFHLLSATAIGVLIHPLLAVSWLYGIPPLAHRLHSAFFPLRERATDISEPRYCAWWGSHQIQMAFIALPALESLLRLVPGIYSAWLRLWGARIGRSVHWTPRVEIADRSLLEVGDGVIFGHKCEAYAHVISPGANGRMLLYVRRVRIGDGVFLGGGCRLGPGAVIESGVHLPVLSDVYVNERVEKGEGLRARKPVPPRAPRAQRDHLAPPPPV